MVKVFFKLHETRIYTTPICNWGCVNAIHNLTLKEFKKFLAKKALKTLFFNFFLFLISLFAY